MTTDRRWSDPQRPVPPPVLKFEELRESDARRYSMGQIAQYVCLALGIFCFGVLVGLVI